VLATVGIWAGIVGGLAAVVAVVPMSRSGAWWAWQALLMRAGVPYSRYATHFSRLYGSYANPYLNREERLDLRSTYVPLSFRNENDAQQVQLAAEVLSDLRQQRTVVIGGPGSGKSTLLQAHGVGVLEARASIIRRMWRRRTFRSIRVTPILIRLRDLATFLDPDKPRMPGGNDIVDYLIREILVKEEFFKSDEQASQFLKMTLTSGYALVMLDGLDEVPDSKLGVLLSAIDDFMTDGTDAHPTKRARLLLTCRSQNFDALRDGWIDSSFAPYKLCALAPLKDSDIMTYLNRFGYQQRFSYLKKQPPLFKSELGPLRFFEAIRDGDKIDLLRVPLVLAMAVSLYAEAPELIPSTIGELYRQMVEEMLDRHSFRTVPASMSRTSGPHVRSRAGVTWHAAQRHRNSQSRYSLNEFQVIDKYSLLRQWALEAAKQTGTFGDFSRERLEKFAVGRADSLNMAGRPESFVEEIIAHSGLLSSAGRDDQWHYAHRSIQEFLAAQELRLDGAASFLLARGNSLDWRQAIQFYVAGQEARQIDGFLRTLAIRNPELAVRCLQGCRPSVQAAREGLDCLTVSSREDVAALAAATHCPLEAVRALAIARLKEAILDPAGVFYEANIEIDEMLPLLDSLSRTNAADIAAVLPAIIDRLPDDPRLVRPLWRCLDTDGISRYPRESTQIVMRLLRLAMNQVAFNELLVHERRNPEFLAESRAKAYPFSHGLEYDHDLVTLLTWADYLNVSPEDPNRFFEAKAAGRLSSLEQDKRRTVSFALSWPARIIFSLGTLGFVPLAWYEYATSPGHSTPPIEMTRLLLLLGLSCISPVIAIVWAVASAVFRARISRISLPLHHKAKTGEGRWAVKPTHDARLVALSYPLPWTLAPLVFGLAAIFAANHSVSFEVTVALVGQLLYWIGLLGAANLVVRCSLRRYNPYIDAYDDPRSRHWLVPGAGPGL
jgi:hypothetical protein